MSTVEFYHFDKSQVHNSEHVSAENSDRNGADSPGFQLPQADIVHQTAPGLFDDLSASSLTDAHLALAGCSDGDRMMLACLLPVTALGRLVASVLLRYGWRSSLGWKEVAVLCRTDAPRVGNCVRDLERAGLVRLRNLSRAGGGFDGYEVIFRGFAVCRLVVEKGYAPLLASSRGILEYHRMLPMSRVSETPTLPDADSRVSETPTLSDSEVRISETPTLLPSVSRVSEKLTHSDDDDLKKINKYSEKPFFNSAQSSGELRVGEMPTLPSSDPRVGEKPTLPGGSPPAWHRIVADGLGSKKVPDLAAMLALQVRNGWSDSLMAEAAEQYVRIYVSRPVSRPDSLFAKVVESMEKPVPKKPSSAKPGPSGGDLPDDGGAAAAEAGSGAVADLRPPSDRQKVSFFKEQYRLGLSDEDIGALWPEIYPGSVAPYPFVVDFLSMSQAWRLVGWLQDQPDPVSPVAPPVQVADLVCCCDEISAAGVSCVIPDAAAVGLWAGALELLAVELPTTTFDNWLVATAGARVAGSDLIVVVPSVFHAAWIEQRMYQTVLRAVRRACGDSWDVRFEVSSSRECPVHGVVQDV